ncbi:MAG: RDD family protein [Phycisphaeraceae bacterium]|nr:RDD family protein [Phycisphaeraceae bacterium]
MRWLAPLLTVISGASAIGADGPSLPPPIGAGSEAGGWVELDYPDTITRAPSKVRPPTHQLYFLPVDTEPGAVYGAMEIPERPAAVAATGSRVVLLFAPDGSGSKDPSTGWMVRALNAIDMPEPLPPNFDPQGRLEVLPALQTDGKVIGLCGVPGGGAAALIRPVTDANGDPIGPGIELRALLGGQWRRVEIPQGVASTSLCLLLPAKGGVSLLTPGGAGSGRATRWSAELALATEPSAPTVAPRWTSSPVTIGSLENPVITVAGDHVLSAQRDPNGIVTVRLHLPDSATELAKLPGIPEDFALLRVGDTAALVYLSSGDTPRIMTAVVHSSTGEVLHSGPRVLIAPLSTDDLRFLGFVLALVLMTALVFVLRPAAASRGEILLPQGTALANPERRLAAGVIDFAIPLLIVVEVWGVGLVDVLLSPIRGNPAHFWPFAVASTGFFVHTVAGEWLFGGRSIGKAILRIRVVSIDARRLTLWQCVSRNMIKLVCPPLLILIFADPRRRHPGDTLAGAVVIARARGPVPPSDDNDDGPGRTNEAPVADG